jgi:hypothetical protein
MSLSLWQMKHNSTYLAVSTDRIFDTGQREIHCNSFNSLLTVHVWLVWSGKLLGHRPLFLWRRRRACICSHVETLRNSLAPELGRRGIEFPVIWFEQNGATAHTARASVELVREIFPEWVTSLRSELPWPVFLPDLPACDYFLWTHPKAKVYTIRPWTNDDFKIATWKQISAIPENMSRRALGNLWAGLEVRVRNDQHLSDVQWKGNKLNRNEMYV